MSDTNISINMYPTGDKYQSDRSSSICPFGDLNKYKIDLNKNKSAISIRSDCYKYKTRIRIRAISIRSK